MFFSKQKLKLIIKLTRLQTRVLIPSFPTVTTHKPQDVVMCFLVFCVGIQSFSCDAFFPHNRSRRQLTLAHKKECQLHTLYKHTQTRADSIDQQHPYTTGGFCLVSVALWCAIWCFCYIASSVTPKNTSTSHHQRRVTTAAPSHTNVTLSGDANANANDGGGVGSDAAKLRARARSFLMCVVCAQIGHILAHNTHT